MPYRLCDIRRHSPAVESKGDGGHDSGVGVGGGGVGVGGEKGE